MEGERYRKLRRALVCDLVMRATGGQMAAPDGEETQHRRGRAGSNYDLILRNTISRMRFLGEVKLSEKTTTDDARGEASQFQATRDWTDHALKR